MEPAAETGAITWTAPECPFRIEYSARVLDDIRLTVVDAFFSLPRGGAEIGGILLGEYEGDRIAVNDYEALDCEHAMGPSFTLSQKDLVRLAEMTARATRNAGNRQPVGWYHSHTRSEIFLSEADQNLHERFFPEPWQIALVLRPHTFEPTRGGFFFRGPGGLIHGASSYREFQLEPLAVRPLRAAKGNHSKALPRAVPAMPQAVPATPQAAPDTTQAVPATPPADPDTPSAAPEMPPVGMSATALEAPPPAVSEPGKPRVPITREILIAPPSLSPSPVGIELEGDVTQGPRRRAIKAAAIVAIGLAAGGAGYQTREYWLPKVLAEAREVLPKEPAASFSLALSDDNGQLKIQWDRNAPQLRDALQATLEISDGDTAPQSVRLDGAHLAAGAFSFAREHERVDVILMATEPGGKVLKEQTSFLGKLPPKTADPQAQRDAAEEKQKMDKLQQDANFQASKIKKLEKDLKAAQDQLQNRQSAPDPTKKN